MFGRKSAPPGAPAASSTAVARARRLPTPDLLSWAESSLYATGRALSDFQQGRHPEGLAEAQEALQAALVCVDEAMARESTSPAPNLAYSEVRDSLLRGGPGR